MKKYYNKLVRDKIPKIMSDVGRTASFRKIEKDEEYKIFLEKKLKEEVKEYLTASTDEKLEELYDIVEVCMTIAKKFYKKGEREFIIGKNKKSNERGSFDDKIVLKSIKEI